MLIDSNIRQILYRYYELWMNRKNQAIGFWDFVQQLRTRSTYFDLSKQALGSDIDVLLAMRALGRI